MPQEVIARKRDKAVLRRDEIVAFVRGIASGEVGEAQMAAFAMAVCLNGMTPAETAALTRAMRDSGATLSWIDLDGPILDKHSTGGVGGQGEPDPGARARRLRRLRPDALGARPRPHRRHAR